MPTERTFENGVFRIISADGTEIYSIDTASGNMTVNVINTDSEHIRIGCTSSESYPMKNYKVKIFNEDDLDDVPDVDEEAFIRVLNGG